MPRSVVLPPTVPLLPDGSKLGGWWHEADEAGRIICDLCPRDCHLRPGDRGFCFVRENRAGEMVLSTYGRSTGFCIDPIEKKPLNHFYSGTSVLSFGTAGCNLGCKFCQNWSISKSREVERLSELASPDAIADAALELGCRSVAFTYNDPVVWAEYAIDAAKACRARGIKTVAVTAGYITATAREPFYEVMDAANVDLKGFTEEFYRHETLSHLQPVLDTLRWLKHESNVWFEITNLIIPRANDSCDEIRQMCEWILENVGPEVPVHFTAFHPDFRMTDRGPTPPQMLHEAYELARQAGLRYVYVGNVYAPREQATHCPACRRSIIERDGYTLGRYELEVSPAGDGSCVHCGAGIAGHFAPQPGSWGSRRQAVRMSRYESRVADRRTTEKTQVPLMQISPPDAPVVTPANRFTPDQEQAIAAAAAGFIVAAVAGRTYSIVGDLEGASATPVLGAFVTLKRQGRLRGCCGFLGSSTPLGEALAHAATRTARDDPRFPPVDSSELPFLDIDVWMLENMQPVFERGADRTQAFTIGRHGLQIVRGQQRGLLLPSVAIERGFDHEAFLNQVCLKAELPATAWREPDTQLFTFEGHEIQRALADLLTEPGAPSAAPLCSLDELQALGAFARNNLLAMATGATPGYFAPELPDTTIQGFCLQMRNSSGDIIFHTGRYQLRDGLPLQSSLFKAAEDIAAAVKAAAGDPDEIAGSHAQLALLDGPALHGTLADADLRGIDAAERAIVVADRRKMAVLFRPGLEAADLLAEAARIAQIRAPQLAQVYSLRALTNMSDFEFHNLPRAEPGAAVRPAAQAARFYPADKRALDALVDRCLEGPGVAPIAAPAVMVPHAGLVYSGRIAGQVLSRIRIPPQVIVIGPKHTSLGVEWAVAPHESWSIPGAVLAADPSMARDLCAAIPGLELDAAAHAQEHAIEVELPFFARLAPSTTITGIAIGGGDLASCREFAAGLAKVVKSLPDPPLLVISSDMNHFADDAANRQLDELALQAMETLDPAVLYDTVTSKRISMCGVLPAVVVLETMRQLGKLTAIDRVGYATSADISGDRSRVVGYAGLVIR